MFAGRAGCSEGPQDGDARVERLRASADQQFRCLRAVNLHSPQGWCSGPLHDMGRDVSKVSNNLFKLIFENSENCNILYIQNIRN